MALFLVMNENQLRVVSQSKFNCYEFYIGAPTEQKQCFDELWSWFLCVLHIIVNAFLSVKVFFLFPLQEHKIICVHATNT